MPNVVVTINPTIHISNVRDTSHMLLAKALIYLVTDTEQTLKTVIEIMPKMPKVTIKVLEIIDVK